jgi:hypothetical protein
MKTSDIKDQLKVQDNNINFVPSDRDGLLVMNTYRKINRRKALFSIYISPENLEIFKKSNSEDDIFRISYYIGICSANYIYHASAQILKIDEKTDYEWKVECHTYEEIKNKVGVVDFNFRKKGKEFYDTVYWRGNFIGVYVKEETLKFIKENPDYNTLRFEKIFNPIEGRFLNLWRILLWNEERKIDAYWGDIIKDIDTEEDEIWDARHEDIELSNAEYDDRRYDATLDDLNGDWGGLYGEEAIIGEQNTD